MLHYKILFGYNILIIFIYSDNIYIWSRACIQSHNIQVHSQQTTFCVGTLRPLHGFWWIFQLKIFWWFIYHKMISIFLKTNPVMSLKVCNVGCVTKWCLCPHCLFRPVNLVEGGCCPFVKTLGLTAYDIPSVQYSGEIIGSVSFAESFLDSSINVLYPGKPKMLGFSRWEYFM